LWKTFSSSYEKYIRTVPVPVTHINRIGNPVLGVNFGFDSGSGSENQTKFRSSTPSYLHWSQELIVDLTALTAV
jgi:hypothetical protein